MAKKPLEVEPAVVEGGEEETTVVYETRAVDDGSDTPQGVGEMPLEIERPPIRSGGGGSRPPTPPKPKPPAPPTAPIETAPEQDPAEVSDEERIKKGDATPEEALAYFQQHGFSDVKTPPTFSNGVWVFPIGAPGSAPHGFRVDSIVIQIVAAPPTSSPPSDVSPLSFPAQPSPTPAPAPGVSRPSPPVPGSGEADRQIGFAIGQVHGAFRAWSESFSDLLQEPHGGVSLWDRMSATERTAAVEQVQAKYNSLPILPVGVDPAHDRALKQGFQDGAAISYSAARWENRAVWVLAELAKSWAISTAATPTPVAIGSAFTDKFSDCAAQTASLVLENTGNPGISPSFLRRNFGLPSASISGYKDALAYALNWFTELGFELSPTTGGLGPISQGGTAGNYVVFFQGGTSGGHVVYGTVTGDAVRLIDGQLGRTWTSVMEAQTALGMRFVSSHRVINVVRP